MTTVRKWSCEESHYVAGNSHIVFIHTLVDVHTRTHTRPNVCTKHTFMHGNREEWSYGQRVGTMIKWKENRHRGRMNRDEEKNRYGGRERQLQNVYEWIFVRANERRGHPTLPDPHQGPWCVTSCLFQSADCIVAFDWLKPPPLPPLFLALGLFLFCFHKQQKGRQGFIKAGDILPPPFPPLHHLNGQITQMGRLPQDNFT